MTTALQILNRGAEIIGYKDPDEALSGNDATNFLGVLNSMVDSWATDSLFVYAVTELTQTVSGNPITVGPGATLNTTRPEAIPPGGFFRSGSTDYGFEQITREQYEAFRQKTTSTPYPKYCYYEATSPTGSLFFYPALAGSGELHLPIDSKVTEFADLATDYKLPPGFRSALEYSLAVELAPGRRPLDPQVVRLAANKRAAIETFVPSVLRTDFDRRCGNILTGWQ